jgi:diguanylate cyclase (GGDEF)-like protein/PAS domain S-box-containing protein
MHKVLIVENNPTIIKLISHFFKAEGCDVRLAEDGLQAMTTLNTFIPDIIFTDIIMPKISGDQLCRIIRQTPQFKDTFIVIYSSITLEDDRHLFELEADLYIAKGPDSIVKKNIRHVIDQYNNGVRRQNVLYGGDGLYPRTITKELLLSRRHGHTIFENLAEAVIEMDCTGRIVQANRAAQVLLDCDLTTLLVSRLMDYLAGPECSLVGQWFDQVSDGGSAQFCSSYDHPLVIKKHLVLLKILRVEEKDKDEFFIIAILQDITSIKETERKLEETVNEFNAVMEAIGYGVLFMDSNLRARIANKAFRKMWGYSDELFSKKPILSEMISFNRYNGIYDVPEDEFDEYIDSRVAAVRKGACDSTEFHRADGVVLQYQCVTLPDNGRMLTYFDITRHKNTEAELATALKKVSDLANLDALTGLPNLRSFQERLLSILSISERKGWKAAVMFIDLDGFKSVNDSFGHEAGDRILKMVAQRLLKNIRKADIVARIGGDEFLIIQTEVNNKADATCVAGKIVQQLSAPFDLNGNQIIIGASIGIAMYPAHGDNSRDLIKKADNAMYQTKLHGKRGYTFASD